MAKLRRAKALTVQYITLYSLLQWKNCGCVKCTLVCDYVEACIRPLPCSRSRDVFCSTSLPCVVCRARLSRTPSTCPCMTMLFGIFTANMSSTPNSRATSHGSVEALVSLFLQCN